jgi:hypothetical protein
MGLQVFLWGIVLVKGIRQKAEGRRQKVHHTQVPGFRCQGVGEKHNHDVAKKIIA